MEEASDCQGWAQLGYIKFRTWQVLFQTLILGLALPARYDRNIPATDADHR
jgi:hypothetical protein